MPLRTRAASSSADTSFAGLLADFAAPAPESDPAWPEADPAWIDSLLADDVATIRHKKTQYRPKSPGPESQPPPGPASAFPQALPRHSPKGSAKFSQAASPVEDRKSASITIRLSKAECELLHKRAAAADLTISAYLRSCVFEVESLRSEVKDAVSQLRSASAGERKPVQRAVPPASHPCSGWLTGLLSRRRREEPPISA